jgi:hypothetical protein
MRRKRFPYRSFADNHLYMIIQDIIPYIILFVEFQPIGSRRFSPEDKALALIVHAPGTIGDTCLGIQFPQVHPAGSTERDLNGLTHSGTDNPGIDDIFRQRSRKSGKSASRGIGKRGNGQRDRFPSNDRGPRRFSGPNKP